MKKLKKFEIWRVSAKEKLEKLGYSVSFFESPPSGNISMGLDFKNPDIDATIMVWECGDIMPEALDLNMDKFIEFNRLDNEKFPLEVVCQSYMEQILDPQQWIDEPRHSLDFRPAIWSGLSRIYRRCRDFLRLN
jgi:hypothetical protein